MRKLLLLGILVSSVTTLHAQKKKSSTPAPGSSSAFDSSLYKGLKWRNIGPTRGGRSVAISGVVTQPQVYYMGSTGGGVWKTEDAGISWQNISDSFFKAGSVGAIAVSESDPNVIYVGMGEHAVRGVMTSAGDGIYKSTDAGKTWKHIGLSKTRHIAAIRIHPRNPDLVYVAAQGAVYGPNDERGIFRSSDGGKSWNKIFYIDENTGCSDLSMDFSNPRILYAGMWDHRRLPWVMISGGKGSALYKSNDGGDSWEKLTDGLPAMMGKTAISVSRANPNRIYANIESEGDKGGVYRSDDAGKKWTQTSKARITVARAWYYIEIFADPVNAEMVYVLNAPVLKSIDGGRNFTPLRVPHGDNHDLWINPLNNQNLINANDGGANVSFNGGRSWSTQQNQPTAQFYRVIADKRFPYYVYGGQQDNSTVAIASRSADGVIGWKDWYEVAGGESAFLAFDPNKPDKVYGGSYLGNISVWDGSTTATKDVMAYPFIGLAMTPKKQQYRFNWNAPIVADPYNPKIIYHAGNKVLRTDDAGISWKEISPDLTRNDTSKQGDGGKPFTNEGAGGEVYNTISYLICSPIARGEIWTGSDCGLVFLTRDEGKNWENITPAELGECLINSIEPSPIEPGTAYLTATKYKFNDLTPIIYSTRDYGKTWSKIINGIEAEDFARVVREDPLKKGLLYAGCERGFYISFNSGNQWHKLPLNLPAVTITDLTIRDNDLIAATSGRAFWILDDLGSFQQWDGNSTQKVILFQPKKSVRIDLPSPPDPVPGQNPATGVIIDYFLPKDMDSAKVQLQVRDMKGTVLRTYYGKKEGEPAGAYEGAPKPDPLLPVKKGVNRFNWDMRKETLPGIPKVFVNGDYRGTICPPGRYELLLMTPKDTVKTICELTADPRLLASSQDFDEQFQLMNIIDTTVKEIHDNVNRMRKVKKQVEDLNANLKELKEADTLVKIGKEIMKKITAWEDNLISPRQETFQDVINFYNRLNAELLNLKSRIDAHDPKVPNGHKQRLKELLSEWNGYKKTLDELINNDVANFNKLYKEKQLPVLIVPKQ